MSTMNAEMEAQNLMQDVMTGDSRKVINEFVTKQVDPGLFQHILTQLRSKGNEAFQKGMNYSI